MEVNELEKKVDLDKIKLLRKKHNISLSEMADLLGYDSISGYFYLESGRVRFSAETIAKVADVLKVQISELFFEQQFDKMANK